MFLSIFPVFSSSSFILLNHTYLKNFEFFFLYGEIQESSFIVLVVDIQFPQHCLSKRLSFPQCMFFVLLSKIIWPQMCVWMCGFTLGCLFYSISQCVCFYTTPCYCNYCSYVVYFEVKQFVLLRITLAIQVSFSFLVVPYEFQDLFPPFFCSSVKKVIGILVQVALNLQLALCNVDIFITLIHLAYNTGCLSIFFVCPLLFCSEFYSFSYKALSSFNCIYFQIF